MQPLNVLCISACLGLDLRLKKWMKINIQRLFQTKQTNSALPQGWPKIPNYSDCSVVVLQRLRADILYISNDNITDAVAISFHSEEFILVALGNVELDERAAAVWVICVCCPDVKHRVSHRSVLR